MQQQQHQQYPSDEDEQRRNRFLNTASPDRDREQRALSQPPTSSNGHAQNLISPSTQQQQQQQQQQSQHIPTSSPWSAQQQRTSAGLTTRPMPMPTPQSVPTRSSSFSAHSTSHFSSAMRDARAFASTFETFEDDEELDDTYDERYFPPQQFRGRPYGSDLTRSRSQSLATTSRPGPIGSPLQSSALWESPASASGSSGPLNIPSGGRYGDIKPPVVGNNSSRYGSLGTSLHQSSSNGYSTTTGTAGSGTMGGNGSGNGGAGGGGTNDISNMSPFVRDVGQIMLDDGNAFRELWAGMHPPRDEIGGGGGSGTTSRRHSVSVVQPRRGPQIVGFNVPGQGQQGQGQGHSGGGGEEATITTRPSAFHTQSFGRGGLMLSDDDLASDLGLLNLNLKDGPGPVTSSSTYGHPPSQPASLPIYAPLSRSPVSPSSDRLSPYQSINLAIPSSVGGGREFPSSSRHHQQQQPIGSPSESGLSAGSPARSSTHSQFDPDASYPTGGQQQQQQQPAQGQLTARFIPGQGIQYLPQTTTNGMGYTGGSSNSRATGTSSSSGFTGLASSPTATRTIQPQQQPYYPHHTLHHQQQQSMNRRSSIDATSAPLTELGKGVPLHSVPASWPLYIVEFKAGRTDLFYLTDLSLDIRVGDLVIVEADRGKDLGTVVNDSITLKEVEEFQRDQMARVGYGDGQPTSPGGTGSGGSGTGGAAAAKKEINPKMIYGKAHGQDTQLLLTKIQDEVKALQLCQNKVRQKKLPMEVIDAEYQWDRRKLTFYFVAEKRIDFRELVRELFRLYKTRIWMASLQGPTYDQ